MTEKLDLSPVKESSPGKESYYYALWEYLHNEHNLTLLEHELSYIDHILYMIRREMNDKKSKPQINVTYILVNALHHLNQEQMQELYAEIGKRMTTPDTGKIGEKP